MGHEDRAAPPKLEIHLPIVDLLEPSADEGVESTAAVQDFQQFVERHIKENHCYGRNGYDECVPFVSRSALDTYWTPQKINHLLLSPNERIRASSNTIRKNYLLTFSILVSMSRPKYIITFIKEHLRDEALPLRAIPKWVSESHDKEVFELFEKYQWKFCPLTLNTEIGPKLFKRQLSPYHIIPILEKEAIDRYFSGEDEVCIYKVTLHQDCSSQKIVIFKTYKENDSDTKQLYENEVDMYTQLDRPNSFDNIIQYYGSFESAGLCTIILEYANGGTLEAFFENYLPPKNQADRELFWSNLMSLLDGLEHIHNLTDSSYCPKGTLLLKGTHQDIRPKNILFCKASEEAIYDVSFKFVDMGTGHIRRTKHQGLERDAVDQSGNGMYSAPEAVRDNGDARGIRAESDIWSLGGIASEAMVWSVWGECKRSEYQQDRVTETRKTSLKGGYHEGAFHDSECLLDVVESWHKETINAAKDARDWYSKLSGLILENMLVPDPRKRAEASVLRQEWRRMIPLRSPTQSPAQNRIPDQLTNITPTKSVATPLEDTSALCLQQGTQKKDNHNHTESQAAQRKVHKEAAAAESFKYSRPRHDQTPNLPFFPKNPQVGSRLNGVKTYLDIPQATLLPPRPRSSQAEPNISKGGPWGFTSNGMRDSNTMERSISDTGREMPSLPTARGELDELSVMSEATAVAEGGTHGIPPIWTQKIEAEDALQAGIERWQRQQHRTSDLMHQAGPSALHNHRNTPKASPRIHFPFPNFPDCTKANGMITIDMVWTTCLAMKERSLTSLLRRRISPWPLFEAFPELTAPVNRLKGNVGRDQIFLVDDSKSMIWHQPAIAKACRVISYVLKSGRVDPDATFELYFTSSKTPVKSKRSSDLQVAIESTVFSDDRCDMASSLDLLASQVIGNSKPVSIYVLTNGHWNLSSEDHFCGVEHPIKRLVTHIKQRDKQRNWAGVQFIRFYDQLNSSKADETGRKRLKALDDELKEMINDDIVDTVDFVDDIRKILIGAISPDIDNSS